MELAGKTALITGVSGQDGSYLAEYLIDQGVAVTGIVRTATTTTVYKNIEKMKNKDKLQLFFGDLASSDNICNLIRETRPNFLFNLAAQSHVGVSFDDPETTTRVNAVGYLKLLEAVRKHSPETRVYQASTSEMFGGFDGPANEETPFRPRSPYGAAKLASHWNGVIYRDGYNLFICNGILFNHESIPKNSPVIIKDGNAIDIVPIEDLFRTDSHKYEGILDKYVGKLVWNGDEWTKIVGGSCYLEKGKRMKLVQTRESSYEATNDHISFKEDESEIKTAEWQLGNMVYRTVYPPPSFNLVSDLSLAKFIGFVVGDGYISREGRIRLQNQ